MSAFQIIGIGCGTLVVVGWLIVSFAAPSSGRSIVEWVATTAMFGGLVTLFVSLSLRAQAAENTFALVAFGFLCVLFSGGLVVSTWNLLKSFGGSRKGQQASATN